jgi:hypothetical protein
MPVSLICRQILANRLSPLIPPLKLIAPYTIWKESGPLPNNCTSLIVKSETPELGGKAEACVVSMFKRQLLVLVI